MRVLNNVQWINQDREHPIKIEDLDYTKQYADNVAQELYNFLEQFGFSSERIDPIECRHRSGFIPFSNNKGGYRAFAYGSQLDGYFEPTGFQEYDELCEQTYKDKLNDLLEENNLTEKQYDDGIANNDKDIIALRDDMEMNYCCDYDSSGIEVMLKLEDESTLYVYCGIGGQDAPYFRSFESNFDFEIKFNSIKELNTKLNKLFDNNDIQSLQSEINWRFF